MAAPAFQSFDDSDPDPPDSALRPESVAALAETNFEFLRRIIPVSRSALSGDLSPLFAFRAVIDSYHRPYASPGVPSTIAGVRVIRYSASDSLPILVYIHGGGWIHRLPAPYARFADELSRAASIEVLAVDYSLSPEAPAGTAIAEAYAVWSALPRDRVLLVGGDSAGASICGGLIFTILERGGRPPDGAVLIYPAGELRNTWTFAARRYARCYGMEIEEKIAYGDLCCPSAQQQLLPMFSAVNGDVTDWPPSLVLTAQFDAARDEGRKLAIKLLDAGHLVKYKCIEGTLHGCITRDGLDAARAEIEDEIRQFTEIIRGNR
jgi:acetyl esterase